MRAELAERLLNEVMGWTTGVFGERVRDLQALADVKYDEYGNYGPGSKFIENLASWLDQFPEDRREMALNFVVERLVFISEPQMNHLIGLVYLEIIAPVLRARIAQRHSLPAYQIAEINRHPDLAALRRASLILGASDGARLDRLRRSSGQLSHEQFLQGATPGIDQLDPMARKLAAALEIDQDTAPFTHVFLVDDFSGSGRSLIREEEDGSHDGKLIRLRDALAEAIKEGFVEADAPVTIVLYVGGQQAEDQVRTTLAAAGLADWELRSVLLLPNAIRVTDTDPDMIELCRDFFDPTTEDEHKGASPIGYFDCALPVVLSHNTPNNSICLLWMDTTDRDHSPQLKALFPRYERHHPDRR